MMMCVRAFLATLLVIWGSGCASVNTQSAVRLANEAQLTTRAIADSLLETRRSLETFVEGQTLLGHLSGRSMLSPSELCSIRAVQRSLRLRVLLLRKLTVLYDTFIALANHETLDGNKIYDEVMADVDRYELLPDATPGPTCPNPDPEPQLIQAPPSAPPSLLSGFSQERSVRQASARIRQVLAKFNALWERERAIYLSIQRQSFLSQKTLNRALFKNFGTVTPAAIFAPQLAGLGLDWDQAAYREQLAHWPADKQAAVREAVLSVLDRRAEGRTAEEDARYAQHSELLRVLYRQHQALEAGQPLDLRQIAFFLSPILQSLNPASGACK